MAAYALGLIFGKKHSSVHREKRLELISNIQLGLMGLLGVMLAFSFSISSGRFEERRQLIIQEAMSIGTTYFRAGLLSDTLKHNLRELLERYVDTRIHFYTAGNSSDDMSAFQNKSEYLQVTLWERTAVIGKKNPTFNTTIVILALNTMIDVSGNISSSFQNHVPKFILLLLIFVAVCTVGTVGYCHGLSSDKSIAFIIILNLSICAILLLIKDMDTPTSGLLKIDISSLLELKKEIVKYTR